MPRNYFLRTDLTFIKLIIIVKSKTRTYSAKEKRRLRQSEAYKVDLTKIKGEGDFPCPNCGVTISPEDETENVYVILETRMKNEALEELVIKCNKCGSKIQLVGFVLPSEHGQGETQTVEL